MDLKHDKGLRYAVLVVFQDNQKIMWEIGKKLHSTTDHRERRGEKQRQGEECFRKQCKRTV